MKRDRKVRKEKVSRERKDKQGLIIQPKDKKVNLVLIIQQKVKKVSRALQQYRMRIHQLIVISFLLTHQVPVLSKPMIMVDFR